MGRNAECSCNLKQGAMVQINMSELPDGKHKKMEKYILRKAFDVKENPYLPAEVLWRQKEQFSDGVGYEWVDGLRDYAKQVSLCISLYHSLVYVDTREEHRRVLADNEKRCCSSTSSLLRFVSRLPQTEKISRAVMPLTR